MNLGLKPFFKNVVLTFVSQAVILLSFFFIYRLVANDYGSVGVGEYSLVKRAVGFLVPFLLLGLSVGLPRYIAMSSGAKQGEYLLAGAFVIAGCSAAFLAVINAFPDFFAAFFFGAASYRNYIVPLSVFLAGLNADNLVYCYLQGRLMVKAFNLLQALNLAIVPLIIFFIFKNSLPYAISLTGIAMAVLSFVFLAYAARGLSFSAPKRNFAALKEIMVYSIPRFPGDFLLGGLLSLSPIFAAHFVSVTKVGYLSVGQSLVTAVGGLAAPLGMVLLPKVSSLLAQGREESIAKSINVYIIAILQCSVFICLQLIIFSDLLIVFWLGKNFVEAVWIVRTSFFASFFYLFYVSMRSIIDAVKVRAVNTINLLVSFLLFVLSSSFVLLPGSNALVVLNASFAGGIVCLAALTYFSLRKIYPCQLSQELRFFLPAFGVSCFLALVSFAVKPFVTNIAYLAGYEILIGTFYLFILFYFKTGWVLEAFEATLNKK